VLSSCSNFTDLQPKGKNLLSTVDQLDLLFNTVLDNYGLMSYDDEELIGDAYPHLTNIPNLIKQPSPSLQQILFTCDEKADRTQYTPSDRKYTIYYDIIGKIANPVLAKVDEAQGDAAKAKQLKAEALVLRAYFGYLAVNHFAKAYNPSTAATDGGVSYPLENESVSEPCKKYMVKEVYDMINADLDAALALNSLPDMNVNQMRVGKAFAYAVKAKVCMSMREYDKAMEAAQQSLAANNTIADYNTMLVNKKSRTGQAFKQFNRPYMTCKEDLFFTYGYILYGALTPEYNAMFEKGNVVHNYFPSDARTFGFRFAGPTYYGLDIECWGYAIDTFFSHAGLTTTDMYLTEAEIDIRNNKIDEAMAILDKIRINRVIPEDYKPLQGTVTTKADAIDVFKKISRSENIWTLKNYINIKRWNTEGNEWTETEKKTVAGKVYTLSPTSPLWIWAFPTNATAINPNLTQNY
jgi:tetratricopeptide (TPR) repeat protein